MSKFINCIEDLQIKLKKHRKGNLKEIPTRTIFIDPLLYALGWDVRNPEDVQLEFPTTIDGKSVDYAPMLQQKPVLFIEAKPLDDPLTDIKSITQVVSYGANGGVDWCILTNGVIYKVYKSSEKAEAPKKLLFEVSLDEKEGESVQKIANLLSRFSRSSMADGTLDEIGEQIFTKAEVRKALDKLFHNPPTYLINKIREEIDDKSLRPKQIKAALKRIWATTSPETTIEHHTPEKKPVIEQMGECNEAFHIRDIPQEVVEYYHALDKYCRELDIASVERKYLKRYIRYSVNNSIFCCAYILKGGLKVWLKLDYSQLSSPPDFVRDVSNIGHWGVGDVELKIDSLDQFQEATPLIKQSFEHNRKY